MTKQANNHPAISVVIPAYNEEKLLGKTLQKLKEQTFQDFEIIIGNNNSTDKTAEVAETFGAHVVNETRKGYAFALNRGLMEAKGAIIAITDADSLPEKTWLAEIAKVFEDKRVAGMTGHMVPDMKSPFFRKVCEISYMLFTRANFLLGKAHTAGFNLAGRREYIQKIGGIDTAYQIGGDVHMGMALKKFGNVIFVRNAVVKSSTRRWEKEASKAFMKYATAYFYTVWFNRPAPVDLSTIR